MGFLTGFLGSVAQGLLGPKGDFADWQHASRLYVTENQKHAPKYKFLYHVTFHLTPEAESYMEGYKNFSNSIGMLVKSADLPKFTAQVETKNKYNRKKNFQTRLDYSPINIVFHDDNYGATTAFLEMYNKFHFGDTWHTFESGAYGSSSLGDTTYKGEGANSYKFGMDNEKPTARFFHKIEIAQMARKKFTRYTLVNPIISDWSHDSVDQSDGSGTMQNSITVNYDTVFYDRGSVSAGGDPVGMGQQYYDTAPSPLSVLGGGGSLDDMVGTGLDLFNYATTGQGFANPFQAAIAAANLVSNVRDTTSEDLRRGGLEIVRDTVGAAAGIDVSGVPLTTFPKNNGTGGSASTTTSTPTSNATANTSVTSKSTPQQVDDAAFQNYVKSYQNSQGSGGIDGARTSWSSLPDAEKIPYYPPGVGYGTLNQTAGA